MGEIPDADGIGMVGNPVCLPPDENIVANPELKHIESITVGEKVLGHDGEFHSVAAAGSRPFVGELVQIKNCFGKTRLTPEHKVLAVKVPKNNFYARNKNKKLLPVEWIEAGLLSKGDLCVYPVLKEAQDIKGLKTAIEYERFDYRSVEIPAILPVDAWISNGYAFLPVTAVAREPYEGRVYNIAVEDSHSYTTPSLAVHNCGDLMYIYIKVENDVITDIKFNTFGCVAAIATSSMITDLAKGKTLEEALKITRQNVANELGGLPPIKMHCSNLAADGLHEAIYDYLKKNKREIPPELEKEHERIKKHDQEEYQEHVH